MRVLHVVGGMDFGGIETWLMNVHRRADRSVVRMDFLANTSRTCVFDAEIVESGSKVIRCPDSRDLPRYARRFLRLLREHGPYDVVHSHVFRFSGIVLTLARLAGVPIRIAHVHTAKRHAADGLLRRAYVSVSRTLVNGNATAGLACSAEAGELFFGREWGRDDRFSVLHSGIDLSAYRELGDREQVRCELGLSPEALVVGHVGRFVEAKNHPFILDVAEELVRRVPDACLLLVGDGPLRERIEVRARRRGIGDSVRFLGSRDDVPRLMNAMDAFVFPSLYEGLGLVAIEAQATGLPCVVASHLPAAIDQVRGLVHRLPLDHPPAAWADRLRLVGEGRPMSQPQALDALTGGPFDAASSLSRLESLYRREMERVS